jgi:hypothetical protein
MNPTSILNLCAGSARGVTSNVAEVEQLLHLAERVEAWDSAVGA